MLPPSAPLRSTHSLALCVPLTHTLKCCIHRFTGTLQDMTLLPTLDWLDLSDNSLRGPLPPLPPSVRWVDLSNNELTGDVKLPVAPRHADDSVALVLLNVANNKLTGAHSVSASVCPFGCVLHVGLLG